MPQLTTPLAKAVRTLEGWLVILTNAGLVIGTSVDPHALPPTEAGILASVLTGLHLASRTLLKLFAVQGTVGIAAPIPVAGTAAKVVTEVEKVAPAVVKEVETVAADVRAPTSAQVERQPAPAPEPPAPAAAPVTADVTAPADPPPPTV